LIGAVFLYREFLNKPLSLKLNFNKSPPQAKLPIVLTKAETALLLNAVSPQYWLLANIMYGSGLRLMETVRLRLQDIDFDYMSVFVWQGKGGGNRRVTLAQELVGPLKLQIDICKKHFDLDNNTSHYQGVWLPFALMKNILPQLKSLVGTLLLLIYHNEYGRCLPIGTGSRLTCHLWAKASKSITKPFDFTLIFSPTFT
jgi:integrase